MKTRIAGVAKTKLLLTFLLFLPLPTTAQPRGPLAPGDEVRVSWSFQSGSRAHPVTSYLELVRMDESQLVGYDRNDLIVIDSRAIRSVKRRIGTKPASAPAMVVGSGAGFAAGFLIGALNAASDEARSSRSASSAGLSTGVLLGAPMGALIAWIASRSHGIYEDVPIRRVRPVATLAPAGRVGVSVRVAVH